MESSVSDMLDNVHDSEEDEIEEVEEKEKEKKIEIERWDGHIEFRGTTRETKARFILVEQDKESAADVWEKMKEIWKMDEPRLIISIIGGAKPFYIDNQIESKFKATISKLSKLPGACIITGGAYSGVMKLV